MPAMKRPAGAKYNDPVKSRTKSVGDALEDVEDLPESVEQMLSGTLAVTLGQQKETRHPFCQRLVEMIGEVFEGHQKALEKDVADKQAAFDELTPDKGKREAAVETAKADEEQKKEAFDKAKQAEAEHRAHVKEASREVGIKKTEQEKGDEELNTIAHKKESLEKVQQDALVPVIEGVEGSSQKLDEIVEAGKNFSFDKSLMQAAMQVLAKSREARTGFDATVIEQIRDAFSSTLQRFADQLATGAPAKAERQAAVEAAEKASQDAEAKQEELQSALAAAREAKDAAVKAAKSAQQSLVDFMPECKESGEELDEAKKDLEEFISGALVAYNELKEWKEGDFAPPPVATGSSYYEIIDGMSCDRGIIDACRTAVAGQGDGRVSMEDAKNVFEKVADGGKETQKERWTMRYCMQEFKWTDTAHDWIVEALKKVPQEGASPAKRARTSSSGYYETVDGYKCDSGIIDACREAVSGQGDGRISREDAEKVWAKAADGNQVTDKEKWTLRYCFSKFNFTRAAHDWLLEQLSQQAAADAN